MFKNIYNKFSLFDCLGLIYFYFNNVFLPVPVTYTSILSVLRLKQIYSKHLNIIIALLVVLAVYALAHNINGVVVFDYFKSLAYFILLIISGFVAYEYMNVNKIKIEKSFELFALISIILLIVSLLFINSPLENLFWNDHRFVGDGEKIRRFKGLAFEPSHMALTLSPLLLYFIWKLIEELNLKNIFYFLCVATPISLSISFGFVAAMLISLVFTIIIVLVHFRKFKRVLILPVLALFLGFAIISFTTNPISERIEYILKGQDSSVNGRTTEAFVLAYQCAQSKSVWLGIGLGQIKYVGEEIIRPYYIALDPGYSKEHWPVMSIPNSMAETLAIFGIVGVLLKICFQIFCFVKFKVYSNYLNLSIFFFIFFYQMMGSFILSTTEIIMWVFAFTKIFPEFDVTHKTQTNQVLRTN